ncbi:MAG: TolC family protein [Pseudomonadota bacterium]
MIIRSLVALSLVVMPLAADSQDLAPEQSEAEALRLADVLAVTQAQFPSILKALAQRRVVQGELEATQGAFDLVINSEGFSRATGFYDGTVVTNTIEQPFARFGGSVYGQYRLSNGDFPIYEDINFTNNGGQAKVGVVLSLLRDRDIDERRFAGNDARLALREADLDVLLTRVAVQQQAALAYWNWVAAGQQLLVYQDLLAIARDRDAGLIRQVTSGARARVFLTENQQNITRRRSLLIGAERDYAIAVNKLGFYYRDAQGRQLAPSRAQLPARLRATIEDTTLPERNLETLQAMIEARPEVRQVRTMIERALQRIRLSENNLKPKLDLRLEVAEGLGSVGEGGVSRDSTDTIVALNFSVPLQRREARARLSQSRAKLDALRLQQQQLEEQIDLELRAIALDLDFAEQLAELAALDVAQSRALEAAEINRFSGGASDFFLVNVREQEVANARIRAISAALATRKAEVSLDAATINLVKLGLVPNLDQD